MLRLLHILILFIASAATAAASTATTGDFDCRWLSHPTPDDTSHVWFSRTIVTSEKDMPRAAYIRVATTGRFVLYVNGRNVSTALFTPDRQKGDTAVAAIAYDVQRFLRTDTNTIALLYCPSMRTRRQVSVCFYGIAADSSHFAVSGTDRPCFALNGNAGWLCRHADTWQTHDGGEAMNRNLYPYRHPARLSPQRAHPHRQPAVRLHGRDGRASLHALLAHRPEHRNHQRRPPLLLRTSAGSGEHLPVDRRTFTRSSPPDVFF